MVFVLERAIALCSGWPRGRNELESPVENCRLVDGHKQTVKRQDTLGCRQKAVLSRFADIHHKTCVSHTRRHSVPEKLSRMACKPDSVPAVSRHGRPFIWARRHRHAHATNPDLLGLKRPRAEARAIPIRFCSRRGLPCHGCCHPRGGLLPHLFTVTSGYSGKPECQRQSVLCGAFPQVALAGGYPAPLLHGVRTFLTGRKPRAAVQPSARASKYRFRPAEVNPSTGPFLRQRDNCTNIPPVERPKNLRSETQAKGI